MFLFIDNNDSFSWNLVQAFYALGRKPVVHANDDPRILELAASPELEAVCISPGPSHPRNAGLCLELLKPLPASVPVLGVGLGLVAGLEQMAVDIGRPPGAGRLVAA